MIAGPCSAESENQMLSTAQSLARQGISLLRAGVWKARTRGGCFEGVGVPGLAWLRNAALATGLPVATEVALPQHVEAALTWNLDCLWIGARTTSNPFSMQELAEALKGIDIPLMVKNPIGADLGLWIGALERLYSAGARRLAAIHRGFKQFGNHEYRNQPCWPIALKLKELIPDLPIFCDPSHICGRIDLIPKVAQKALSLGFDGLFIEAHSCPKRALTDAKQQLHPDQLGALLKTLASPSTESPLSLLGSPS